MTIGHGLARRSATGRWLVGVPAVIGMVALVAVTAKGLYVSPDSVFYVGTARNIVDGAGFRSPPGLQPLAHFPPLFTLLLAAVGAPGLDPLDAARVVNVLVLGALALLVGLVLRSTTGSAPAALAGAVLTVAAVDVLSSSASALSEPLFVSLALAGLVALAAHLDRRRPALLVVAAALVALAVLTRYVGVALVVAGAAVLVWRGSERRAHGARDAALFAVIALVPVMGWLAWAGRLDGTARRSFAFHLFDGAYLAQAPRPLGRWIVPWPAPPLGPLLALALLIGATMLLRRRGDVPKPEPVGAPLRGLPVLLGAFAASYLLILVANRVFVDATGRLDARFLMPLHVVAVVAAVPVVYHRRAVPGVTGAAVALLVVQVAGGLAWVGGGLTDDSVRRRGYTARAWQESDLVARVAATGPDVPVYSNGFDALFLLTGRAAIPIPAEKDYSTGRVNKAFEDDLAHMRADLERAGGLLVYFDAVTARQSFLPSRADLERALPLEVVATDDLGTMYRLP